MAAVAGDCPVADAHDDPGHVTWGWKDEMLGARQWYYAKVLRGKATKIHMTSRKSDSPFSRAVTHLQRDFKILPVGISQSGGWRYSFIYDAVHRHYPDLPRQARTIGRGEAREQLDLRYVASLGAAAAGDVRKVFQWRPRDVQATLQRPSESGRLHHTTDFANGQDAYIWPALHAPTDL